MSWPVRDLTDRELVCRRVVRLLNWNSACVLTTALYASTLKLMSVERWLVAWMLWLVVMTNDWCAAVFSARRLAHTGHARAVIVVRCQRRVGHGLDPSMDWIGLDWVRWLQSSVFFIDIFSILTTDKRWRCNTIMCILADFNRLWLDCEFYKTLRLGSIALGHLLI